MRSEATLCKSTREELWQLRGPTSGMCPFPRPRTWPLPSLSGYCSLSVYSSALVVAPHRHVSDSSLTLHLEGHLKPPALEFPPPHCGLLRRTSSASCTSAVRLLGSSALALRYRILRALDSHYTSTGLAWLRGCACGHEYRVTRGHAARRRAVWFIDSACQADQRGLRRHKCT